MNPTDDSKATPTPRTDHFANGLNVTYSEPWANFARQLERELAQREQRIAALESQMGTLCDVAMHYSHYPSEENASCLSAEIKKSHAISTPTATSPATN